MGRVVGGWGGVAWNRNCIGLVIYHIYIENIYRKSSVVCV